MVINGGSRSGLAGYTGYLGRHLQRRDQNEAVFIREMTGVLAPDLTAALDEMAMMGAGSRSKRPLYHANIDWRHDEHLTPEQKRRAIDRLADELELTGQPRIVVEHTKQGREHLHVVWLRIDPATGKAISDSHNFRRHEIVARDLEREFGLDRVQGVHIERDGIERPARTPEPHEFAQAARTGLTPAEAKAEISGLWHQADSGQAFAAALDGAGWTLARGDKRDFVVLDPHGEAHSLARRVEGVKAAQVRARMADIDPATLPSVDEARQVVRDRQPMPVPEMGGAEVAAPLPEATQRPSCEAAPEPPPDLDARFGPSEPELTSPAPPEPEPPYVPNFVLVVDLTDLDARFGPGPDIDPEAGMVIDAEPEQLHQVDELDQLAAQRQAFADRQRERADLDAENTPQHRQARPHQVDPEPEAVRRQEPAHGLRPSAADADARRAMEDLARTDPLGMAARHGFHAGDRLKSPLEMRQEMAERMRGFAADPQPVPEPTPEPSPSERLIRAMADPAPEPKTPERSRLADLVAAAREKLADLADRLETAFSRIMERRPTPEVDAPAAVRPRPTGDDKPQAEPSPRQDAPTLSVAERLLEAGRRRQRDDADRQREIEREAERKREQERGRDLFAEIGQGRRMKRPGDFTP